MITSFEVCHKFFSFKNQRSKKSIVFNDEELDENLRQVSQSPSSQVSLIGIGRNIKVLRKEDTMNLIIIENFLKTKMSERFGYSLVMDL